MSPLGLFFSTTVRPLSPLTSHLLPPFFKTSKKILCYSLILSMVSWPFPPAMGMMGNGAPSSEEEWPSLPPRQALRAAATSAAAAATRNEERPKRIVRILSVDGGGIRGLIPAKVLAELEAYLQTQDYEATTRIGSLFDVVIGTSTGGIVVTATSVPIGTESSVMLASKVVKLYKDLRHDVFPKPTLGDNVLGRLCRGVKSVFTAKYDNSGFKKKLDEFFGKRELQRARTDGRLMLVAYDVRNCRTHVFDTHSEINYPIAGAVLATTAAPTYFDHAEVAPIPSGAAAAPSADRPAGFFARAFASVKSAFQRAAHVIQRVRNKDTESHFIDGGVVMNNPALYGLLQALETVPDADGYEIISLGTGRFFQRDRYNMTFSQGALRWAKKAPELMITEQGSLADESIRSLQRFFQARQQRFRYIRVQPSLEKDIDLAATDDETIGLLERMGTNAYNEHVRKFREFIADVMQMRREQRVSTEGPCETIDQLKRSSKYRNEVQIEKLRGIVQGLSNNESYQAHLIRSLWDVQHPDVLLKQVGFLLTTRMAPQEYEDIITMFKGLKPKERVQVIETFKRVNFQRHLKTGLAVKLISEFLRTKPLGLVESVHRFLEEKQVQNFIDLKQTLEVAGDISDEWSLINDLTERFLKGLLPKSKLKISDRLNIMRGIKNIPTNRERVLEEIGRIVRSLKDKSRGTFVLKGRDLSSILDTLKDCETKMDILDQAGFLLSYPNIQDTRGAGIALVLREMREMKPQVLPQTVRKVRDLMEGMTNIPLDVPVKLLRMLRKTAPANHDWLVTQIGTLVEGRLVSMEELAELGEDFSHYTNETEQRTAAENVVRRTRDLIGDRELVSQSSLPQVFRNVFRAVSNLSRVGGNWDTLRERANAIPTDDPADLAQIMQNLSEEYRDVAAMSQEAWEERLSRDMDSIRRTPSAYSLDERFRSAFEARREFNREHRRVDNREAELRQENARRTDAERRLRQALIDREEQLSQRERELEEERGDAAIERSAAERAVDELVVLQKRYEDLKRRITGAVQDLELADPIPGAVARVTAFVPFVQFGTTLTRAKIAEIFRKHGLM